MIESDETRERNIYYNNIGGVAGTLLPVGTANPYPATSGTPSQVISPGGLEVSFGSNPPKKEIQIDKGDYETAYQSKDGIWYFYNGNDKFARVDRFEPYIPENDTNSPPTTSGSDLNFTNNSPSLPSPTPSDADVQKFAQGLTGGTKTGANPSPAATEDNLNFVNNAPYLSPTPSNADVQKFTQGITSPQCTKYSGSCSKEECNSEKLIGMLDCPNSAPFCCGNASAAQQQMLGNTPGGVATPGGGNQSSGFGNPLGDKTTTIKAVLENITSYLRGIAGVIAVIFIIIGGIMYMVSGGSKETTERAKKTLICAIAGLAIVLAAPLFYQEIKAVLSGNNPGSALQQLLLNILRLLLSIIGFIAIISMVVGAMWMFTAVGDEEKYELGKKTATYSILGLVIAVAALILAQEVVKLVGGGSSTPATYSPSAPNSQYLPPSSLPSGWNRGGQD